MASSLGRVRPSFKSEGPQCFSKSMVDCVLAKYVTWVRFPLKAQGFRSLRLAFMPAPHRVGFLSRLCCRELWTASLTIALSRRGYRGCGYTLLVQWIERSSSKREVNRPNRLRSTGPTSTVSVGRGPYHARLAYAPLVKWISQDTPKVSS